MAYALVAAPSAQRELDALPPRIAAGIRAVLRALAAEPRSHRFDLKRLAGVPARLPALRLRVGEYRIILAIDHDGREILVARIGHRKAVYRGLPARYD